MFPEGVETIIMTKENYDKNVEQLLLDKSKLEIMWTELKKYVISKLEEENKDAYDSEVEVSDAYIIYEKMLDKMNKLKEGIFDD